MRRLTLIVLSLLFLLNPLAIEPVAAGLQDDSASVSLSPTYQELGQGETTTLTVVGQSTLGGSVFVNIPNGLDLLGDPTCISGCGVAFVTEEVDGTRIDFKLDGQIATVSFTMVVSSSTPVGTVFSVNAYLVGGSDAVEMSSATIGVIDSLPTPTPSASQERPSDGVSPSIRDNRMVYLEVSPPSLRIAPGGEALFTIQPVRWGMWEGQSPQIDVIVTVPEGFSVSTGPACGRGDSMPENQPCSLSEPTDGPEGKEWTIRPGYSASDGGANGVFMTLRASDDLEYTASARVGVSAVVHDDSLAEQPAAVESSMLVVDPASLHIPQPSGTDVGAVLELYQGYAVSGATCVADDSSSQVGLWELGVETLLGVADSSSGVLGMSSDGSGAEVCLVPVLFPDVPPRDLYVLGSYDGMDFPCRACIYGTITTTRGAEVVFPIRW